MSTFAIITIVAVFGCVAAMVGGIALMFRGGDATPTEDRLQQLAAASEQRHGGNLFAEGSLLAQTIEESRENLVLKVLSQFGDFRKYLEQADTNLTASQFGLLTGGLALAGFVLPLALRAPWYLAPFVAIAAATLPLMFVIFKRKRRIALFGKQLPDALELVSRALLAGHSLGAAFSLVASEAADPIRKEFARCYDEQNLGKPLEEALEAMTDRVPNVDLRFFATAVILQRQTGGDLAEILDKIGYLIRERFKIWGQVQALTGEGRLSGIVLLALPPVLFVVMYKLNPQYCMVLFTDDLGQQMLAGAIVMQLIGAMVIRKIVNIKV